jgi:hypothetical protein
LLFSLFSCSFVLLIIQFYFSQKKRSTPCGKLVADLATAMKTR